mmetsp:Transcript_98035/g.227349  ORF Transcript_98035/g.227349 Transcript_98035/m.227349 type:complete len:235 (-) Transcript_98035:241-945(-)
MYETRNPKEAMKSEVYNPELGGLVDSQEPMPPQGCGSCLQEDGTKSLVWKFVGEGRGSFNPLQSYEYVGHGRGTHEKEVVVTPGKFNMQKVCIVAILVPLCLAILGLVIYSVLNAARAAADTGDEGVVEEPSVTTEPVNCNDGLEASWSDAQRDFCCGNHGIGCLAVEVRPQVCQTQCHYLSHTATCAFRTQWGANHRFRASGTPCRDALAMVKGQCSVCAGCNLQDTGCSPPR